MRHPVRLSLRLSIVLFVGLAGLLLVGRDSRHVPPAAANPAFGSVKFNPSSGIIIEGYLFNVAVQMNTCADTVNIAGSATSASTTTLTDTAKSWTMNQWTNYAVQLTFGPGSYQQRTVTGNSSNTLTVSPAFFPAPAVGTKFEIVANSGLTTSSLSNTLTDTTKSWTTDQFANQDVVLISGPSSIQQRKVLANTGNTLTIDQPWGNIQQFGTATGGTTTTLGDVRPNSGGTATAVTTSTLTDTTKAWVTDQWSAYPVTLTTGTGSPQTKTVLSNTSNTLTISGTWSPSPVVGTGYQLGWTPNQFAGMSLELTGPGGAQSRSITSNTPTVLTVSPAWATSVSGESATGGTSTTLVDTSHAGIWTTNAFANKIVELTGGAMAPESRTIASNTADTLTISGTWPVSTAGGANGGTATTITDLAKTWTVNAYAGLTIELTSGLGAGQTRTVLSNTSDTITISGSPWTPIPDNTTVYQVLRTPSASTQYIVRDGPANGTGYQIRQASNPQGGGTPTGYQILKLACHVGGYGATVNFPSSKFTVVSDSGVATSATSTTLSDDHVTGTATAFTTTTLTDTAHNTWTPNQWAGASITLVSGTGAPQTKSVLSNTADTFTISGTWSPSPAVGTAYQIGSWKTNQWVGSQILIKSGAGFGQIRTVVSNTATTMTISKPWNSSPPATQPTSGSVFSIGGITDGGWIDSTGRVESCPNPAVYGTGTATLGCVSYGALPQGVTGSGNIVNLTLQAGSHQGNVLQPFTLTSTEILQVDATVIPADVLAGTRRVILCPDSAPLPAGDGLVNSGDQAAVAQAFNKHIGDPLYSPKKDPNEDTVINNGDQTILSIVFGKRCVQP